MSDLSADRVPRLRWLIIALAVLLLAAIYLVARPSLASPLGSRHGSSNQCSLPVSQRTGGWACPN